MSHANAPLTPAGRGRLVRRCEHRPIAHVAAEAGVSRQCLSKWKARFDELGEVGLADRASVPHRSPTQLDPCLLYTSDAADEEDSVDLGGRRIIKKKKKKKKK